MKELRVALVQDYLYQFGGAEKVVEKWMQMYPKADLYTSLYVPDKFQVSPTYVKAEKENRIKTTWLQPLFKIKFMLRFFKHLFWVYPVAMSTVEIKDYDVVFISSTYCSKNVHFKNVGKVIHYCHSPTRYLHGLVRETDMKTINPILRKLIPIFTFWLKIMDLNAVKYLKSQNAIWVANSKFMQKTVGEIYKVDPIVIYPPIETSRFGSVVRKPDNQNPFYFHFGRISFHKKIELIVEACIQLKKRLVVAGMAGFKPEMDKLKSIVKEAENKDPAIKGFIKFEDRRVSDEEICEYLEKCQAFLFPAKEDSGMVPIEVMTSGTPVIAFGEGGALEYVHDLQNGILFTPQTVEGVISGIKRFEAQKTWDEKVIRDTALDFSEEEYIRKFDELARG